MFLHDFFDTKKSAVKEGETTLTKTGRVHRSTDAYGGTPREPDSLGNKLDKAGTNSIERALDIKWDRKKEWQGGVEVDTSEGMAGELIGGTIGGVAGTLGGAAVGGPVGALVGGAAGGTAGQMAGRELTKEEGRERIYSNGDRVKLNSTYADYRNPNEIFTVSQCDQERKRCWIGDKSGSGWYATFDQLIPARSRAKEDDTKLNKNIDNGHLRMLVHRAMKARQAGKPLTSIMRSDEIKTLLMAKGTGQLKNLFAEDSWHGEGEAWHGGGNDPKDAWHGQEGVTEEQLDEFLPALAAGAGALARGAAMAGGAALKGAQAVGNAVVKGAQAVAPGVVKTGQAIGKVPGQVEKGLIKGFEVLDALVPGGIFDANGNIKSPQILSKFLTPQQIQQVQQQPVQQQSPSQQVAQNQQQVAAEGFDKIQEVKKFRTTYGWAGGSKEPREPRSAHAKQVAAKRKEYEKGLGKFEPTDNMVGVAKIVRDIAMSDASPEHKKAAIDALNKKGVAETRIETIHGSAYTIDPNKYYVWAWDNAVVLYGEYTDENDAELNLSKIERRATKRLGPAVKGRFEVASGKMLLRQYGNEQGVAEELSDASPITGAITRRILKQRLDLLKQYGPELVGAAIDNVADYVGDVDEIGSSDVSAWVAQVERMLQDNPPEAFAEGFPHDVDHMPGKTIKHQDTNCTTCHGRKSMYKLGNKLSADNKQGAEKVKCPTCKGTGDKPGVTEAEGPGRVDPILYKALARMTKGGYDDAKIALAIEFGLLDMKHNYAIADNYIPKLVDLYNQKHGVAEGDEAQSSQPVIPQDQIAKAWTQNKSKAQMFIKNVPVAIMPTSKLPPNSVDIVKQEAGKRDQTSYSPEKFAKGLAAMQAPKQGKGEVYIFDQSSMANYGPYSSQITPALSEYLQQLGIDSAIAKLYIKKVPTPFIPASVFGIEGKRIQTSWGDQAVDSGAFITQEANGHTYCCNPDSEGLPIGYIPAQQGVAEGSKDLTKELVRRIEKSSGGKDTAKRDAKGILQLVKNTNKKKGVAEGKSDYKIKSIGTDSKGDYYISPSTGKKVYKKAKVGDHENPKTGEHKGVSEGANYWTKLQDTRNKKINSLVNELEKSIK